MILVGLFQLGILYDSVTFPRNNRESKDCTEGNYQCESGFWPDDFRGFFPNLITSMVLSPSTCTTTVWRMLDKGHHIRGTSPKSSSWLRPVSPSLWLWVLSSQVTTPPGFIAPGPAAGAWWRAVISRVSQGMVLVAGAGRAAAEALPLQVKLHLLYLAWEYVTFSKWEGYGRAEPCVTGSTSLWAQL